MVQKKFVNLIFLFCMAYFCGSETSNANAKVISVIIKLDSIELKKFVEEKEGEFYIGVTQYSSLGSSKTDRVPAAPAYWLSPQLPFLNNIVVWEGGIEAGEEVKVILSWVKKDVPENLIGSAQLVLTNHKDHLKKQWEVPVFEERVAIEVDKSGNIQRFLMKGDKAEYTLQFHVDEK